MYAPFAIDARWYGSSGSGITTYAHSLLAGLMEMNINETIHVIVNRPEYLPEAVARSRQFHFIELLGNPMSLQHQRMMPKIVAQHRIECLHTVDVHAPLLVRCRRIITCHDVIPLVLTHRVAGGSKSRFAWLWRRWLQLQCRWADRVVTISECSRRDLMNALGIGAERICVIPPALYTAERRRTAAEPSQRSWPVEDGAPLILSVGRRAPYKNLAGLLDAFELLRRQHTAPYRLLIIGPIDPRYRDLEARAERLGLTGQVIFTGYVPDSDLAELYRRASLFVHPSLYEGFGLPVLEAMAAGVPVVSSNRSSLPEVCGEAALLVDPTDTAAMAAAMAQVLSDDQLSARLRREGLLRAKNFTPRIMAERLLKLYIEACGAGAGKK